MTSRTPTTSPPITPTSWRLLARAQHGERTALEQLLLRYLPRVRRWARGRLPPWIRSTADTSDLLQDAVLNTLARLDVFQPRGRHALALYLKAAVRNRIADEHRHAARWATTTLDALRSREATPLDQAIAAETERRYRAALDGLSRRDRDLIVGHVELGYSHAQLGCMIGRSPHAARMALGRAIARLAERMRV